MVKNLKHKSLKKRKPKAEVLNNPNLIRINYTSFQMAPNNDV